MELCVPDGRSLGRSLVPQLQNAPLLEFDLSTQNCVPDFTGGRRNSVTFGLPEERPVEFPGREELEEPWGHPLAFQFLGNPFRAGS